MSSFFKASTTHDPIKRLLSAYTKEERDQLTEEWRDHKLQELNFIGAVVSSVPLHDFSLVSYGTMIALFEQSSRRH